MRSIAESRRSKVYERKKTLKKFVFITACALGVIFLVVILFFIFRYGSIATETIFNNTINFKREDEKLNILILGIGGGRHEGPNLTDTIIFASIDADAKKITLISIPRDFWSPDLDAKINTAYAFAEEKDNGSGLNVARDAVGEILGQPIDYVVRLDFDGFVKAVDLIGGLDVEVERSFDDYEYPISGKEEDACGKSEEEVEKLATAESQLEAFPCRYEHLSFVKGVQFMDGETALKYVRSRHGSGGEGSDFARSKRQEQVISSFRDKVFSLGTILNPVKLVSLYDVLKGSIDTDIRQDEYDDFIKLAKKMEDAKIESVVLDIGDPANERYGLLTNPLSREPYRGQWVIVPRLGNGDFTEIQEIVKCSLSGDKCVIEEAGIRKITPTPSSKN